MSAPFEQHPTEMPQTATRNRGMAGIALILLGLVLLLRELGLIWVVRPFPLPALVINGRWFGLLILPTLGFLFLAWGIATRQVGLLIPGCVLGAIGAAVLLLEGPLAGISGQAAGGVILIAMATGWAAITLLSSLLKAKMVLWPLIPGSILGLIGMALLFGQIWLQVLIILGQVWPAILIILGIILIYKTQQQPR